MKELYYLYIYGKEPLDMYQTSARVVYIQAQKVSYFVDTHWLGVL